MTLAAVEKRIRLLEVSAKVHRARAADLDKDLKLPAKLLPFIKGPQKRSRNRS